ncbi:MAG: methyltransferase domain-containing protein [Burkholderiales bacterium]|nr:methyltransferase domain-containing protein [Burkholderiales bacterium]
MTTELSFTGERFHPNLAGEMWAEHWHRYHFVLPLVAGRTVLDVASGEGYGSALMAGVAGAVSGLDVSAAAVAHASAAYAAQQNLRFTEGSCAQLPFGDAVFDVVVSFETLEHIHEQDEFVDEIKRVLKPSGLLIMSSPNRAEYSDARGYSNEFHVKELYRAQLLALLGARFQHMRWFSQRNAFVSMIVPDTGEGSVAADTICGETLTVTKANPETLSAALPALYFVVVAGNNSAVMERVGARVSVFGDSEEWAYNDYRQIYKASVAGWSREQALNARCAELEQQLAALRSQTAASVENAPPNLEK